MSGFRHEPREAPPSPEDQPYAEDGPSPIAQRGDDGDDEMDIEEDEDADMDIDEEDEDDEMEDEEAEEEHSAPAYPVVSHYRYLHGLDSEVARLLAISSTSNHPLYPWSSSPPQIPCPINHNPSTSPGYEVGESSAAAAARPAGGFRADYGFVATMDRQVRRDPERYVGYGITDAWDEIVETLQGAPVSTDLQSWDAHMRVFESLGLARYKMRFYTSQLMETEAGMQREARALSDMACDADLAHGGVIYLLTPVAAQMA
ncbi:hypothetical protein Tco_0299976 [Tanacetum coccineum]